MKISTEFLPRRRKEPAEIILEWLFSFGEEKDQKETDAEKIMKEELEKWKRY